MPRVCPVHENLVRAEPAGGHVCTGSEPAGGHVCAGSNMSSMRCWPGLAWGELESS